MLPWLLRRELGVSLQLAKGELAQNCPLHAPEAEIKALLARFIQGNISEGLGCGTSHPLSISLEPCYAGQEETEA